MEETDRFCTYDIGPKWKPGLVNPKPRRQRGRIYKEAPLTVTVVLPDGRRIKRHKTKHNVTMEE